ncbi:MAG: tetratricopeptide repeat protein, partial [Bacteroidia bacterium]
ISTCFLYATLFEKEKKPQFKKEGLALLKEAKEVLAIYQPTHPQVQVFMPAIEEITASFGGKSTPSNANPKVEKLLSLVEANQKEKNPQKKVERQQEIIKILLDGDKANPNNVEFQKAIAKEYGSLAWYQLFTKEFSAAEQSAKAGLAKDNSEVWINTNLALALLYQGKWEEAKNIYTKLKDQPHGKGRYKAVFLKDLKELEKAGIKHKDVEKARKLLK